MNMDTIVVGDFEVNCFVLHGTESRCVVVDPGKDADAILDVIRRQRLSVDGYILTHGHFDHLSALADLYDRHPAPVACHPRDWEWAFTPANAMPPQYGPPRKPSDCVPVALSESQPLAMAGLTFRVIETPGHTPGSVCLYLPGEHVLITGDTLFAGSVGRTDLPGGSARALSASLKKLAALPPETTVHPGHGPATDIAAEKRTNYFMQHL
jgi:hydroxyacylglutathione hydrolase